MSLVSREVIESNIATLRVHLLALEAFTNMSAAHIEQTATSTDYSEDDIRFDRRGDELAGECLIDLWNSTFLEIRLEGSYDP